MNNEEENQNEINLETFRLKKLIQNLDQMRGLGTSMITLIINHQDQINHSSEMLNDEIRKASSDTSTCNGCFNKCNREASFI